MKKIMYLMVAALAVLMASSCSKENAGRSDEATMTLSISIPDGAVTKSYGDGQYDAKNVIIGVFDENGVEKLRKNFVWEKNVFEQEVQIRFIMGKKYQLVLWAQYGNAYGDPRTMALNEIRLDYSASNREELDAFYAHIPVFEVRQDFNKSIVLTRPFAQLNFATTIGDMDESVSDLDMTGLDNTATVTISNVANTLNLFTGETSFISDGDSEGEKGKVVIPATAFPTKIDGKYPTINVDGVVYEVISMNYVLVADAGAQDGKTTVDLQLKVGELVVNVPNAYMKRNWRTNVVGELLTAEGSFKVSLDPDFNGSYNEFWNSGMSSESEEE